MSAHDVDRWLMETNLGNFAYFKSVAGPFSNDNEVLSKIRDLRGLHKLSKQYQFPDINTVVGFYFILWRVGTKAFML